MALAHAPSSRARAQLSRARFGLYIFCRVSLFRNCHELQPAFQQLLRRPTALHIVPGETHPTPRPAADADAMRPVAEVGDGEEAGWFEVEGVEHMGVVVQHASAYAE